MNTENNKNSHSTKETSHKLITLLIALIIIAILSIFLHYENSHLVITEYTYANSKIPIELDGFCIVQISDLHNAQFGKDNNKLISKIKNCNPDIIILTGDLVDGTTHTNISKALNFVELAVKICPVYYITGNHEYYLSENMRQKVLEGLENAGAIILFNEAEELAPGANLIGIDDNSLISNTLKYLVDDSQFNIALAHEPQYINRYADSKVDLIFCGHAHGGQFRLPIIGAVYAPDQGINPEYTEGTYIQDSTTMIVSRGIGNSAFPFRLFNDPEIVCVRLSKE